MFDFTITYDDGRTEDVTAGQREMAAWEREPFGCGSSAAFDRSPVLFFRYLAYAALRRQRRLAADEHGRAPSFEVWSEGVDSVKDDDTGEPADPTNPATPPEG